MLQPARQRNVWNANGPALLGGNGAGKTTTLKEVSNLLRGEGR